MFPFVLAIVIAPSPIPHNQDGITLAQLRDHARPVLIFAPTANDPRVKAQMEKLEPHRAGLDERDVLIIVVPAAGTVPVPHLTPQEAVAARERFGIGSKEFAVLLIGKDGGEKLRAGEPVEASQLNELIDAMPMRQQEMR